MRARVLVIVASGLLGLLLIPATSFAGVYSWNEPANFTATAPGSNPDHDPYGALPWSYQVGASPTFTASGGLGVAGLAGWTDATDPPFIGTGTGTDGTDPFSSSQLYMTPSATTPVSLTWTSPIPHTVNVTVSGSVTPDDPNSLTCLGTFTSSLDLAGTPGLINPLTGAISGSAAIPAGGAIHLNIAAPTLGTYDQDCATAAVSFSVQATETVGPGITLNSPSSGSVVTGGQPVFSGLASNGFGASDQVTVRVYSGSGTNGIPAQTISTTRGANGAYSAGPNAPLADGQYTAQAEQDDVSSPPDPGFSAPSTFTVQNHGPTVALDSLGTRPLSTASPTITGTAGSGPADADTVSLAIFSGPTTNGQLIRAVSAPVDQGGHFQTTITPALPDGQYTVVASQQSGAGQGVSAPMSFQISIGAPAVTLDQPANGSTTIAPSPTFSGKADTGVAANPTVTVVLYKGASAAGTPVGTVSTTQKGGAWTAGWPTNLPVGTYTAVAEQSDVLGRTGVSPPHTFQIVPGPAVVGNPVALSKNRVASVVITCYALSGQVCTGDVMVLTTRSFTPVPGGPSGQMRVMFQYVKLAPGTTTTISQTVSPQVYSQLKRAKTVNIRISAMFGQSGGGGISSSSVRTLHT